MPHDLHPENLLSPTKERKANNRRRRKRGKSTSSFLRASIILWAVHLRSAYKVLYFHQAKQITLFLFNKNTSDYQILPLSIHVLS